MTLRLKDPVAALAVVQFGLSNSQCCLTKAAALAADARTRFVPVAAMRLMNVYGRPVYLRARNAPKINSTENIRFECCKVVKKVRAIKRGDHQSRRPEISLCPVPGALLVPEGAPRAYPHCTLKLSRRNPFTVGILTELRARDGEPDWSTLPGGPRREHVPLKYLSDQS